MRIINIAAFYFLVLLPFNFGEDYKKSNKTVSVKDRISEGQNVTENKYPFIVMAKGCGASLISPDKILTAAHCKDAIGDTVWIGRVGWTGGRKLKVSNTWVYPGKDKIDIMIAKISPQVNDYEPIILDSGNDGYSDAGVMNTVVGWGDISKDSEYIVPNTLQEMSAPILSQLECGEICDNGWWPLDTEICMKQDVDKSTGAGDKGSPMFYNDNGNFIQTGIVHSASECKKYGIYTRVSELRNWILENAPNAIFSDQIPNRSEKPDDGDTKEISCKYGDQNDGAFMEGNACKDKTAYNMFNLAKKKCCDCNECNGITMHDKGYSIRKGPDLEKSSLGEISWRKI